MINQFSIILPVYNESESLNELYYSIERALSGGPYLYEILFINDGSTDSSLQVLRDIAENDQKVKIISFKRNYGQTAAMMAGIDHAQYSVIVPMDSDLQNDPSDIPRLLKKLNEGYDVCSGWRFDRKDHPIKRNFLSRVANSIISNVSGVHLHDYGCSLKAYRSHVIKDIKLYGEMHRFVPIYATWQGAKVTEIPVAHHERKYGESKYGMERVLKVVLDLIVVKFLEKYSKKPIYVFGGFGLLSAFFGVLALLWALVGKIFFGISFVSTPLLITALFLITICVVCILMGLLAELLTRTWHESQAKDIYHIKEKVNI